MVQYLTADQAAERMGTKVRFVRRLIEEQRIAVHHFGRHVRLADEDLDAFIAASRTEPKEVNR